MNGANGWICLHRKLMQSSIWGNEGLVVVWIWCLMRASHTTQTVWMPTGRGKTSLSLLPGQFVCGRFTAGDELSMNPETVRHRLEKLVSLGNITLKSTTHFTVVTVCKWERYQMPATTKDQPTAQPTAQPNTTYNNVNNGNKVNKTDLPPIGGDHIPDSGKKPPGKPKAPAEPKPPAPYRELTDYFCSRWAETHAGEKYPFNGRDGKNCATIWEYVEHNLDKAKKIIDTFLICREPFFAGHKLAKLAADLPKFIAAAYPPAPSPKPRMTVAEAMARTKRIREQQELENGIDNRRRNPD